jgi:hypothetical protein
MDCALNLTERELKCRRMGRQLWPSDQRWSHITQRRVTRRERALARRLTRPTRRPAAPDRAGSGREVYLYAERHMHGAQPPATGHRITINI